MKYNFDEIIDRKGTNAMNTDGFRQYIFNADETLKFPYEDDEFIRMWVADMEFATPQVIIDAIKERLDRRIFGYTKVFSESFYTAFVNWCIKRYGWSFERKHLVTSNGIVPALYELVDYICKSDEKTTLFILCNPHNPTGRVWTEEELRRMGEICIEHNVWMVSDEIHCDLLRKEKTHIPMAKLFPDHDKIITCMAPSKTFNMAGLMFSNVIIPNDKMRELLLSRHYSMDNPLSIAGAQAAYEQGEDWLEELRVYLDENFAYTKEYLAEHLPEIKFRVSEATYLAWVDVSAYFGKNESNRQKISV